MLLGEVLDLLDPRGGEVYVDGTLGGAGHATAIAERLGPEGLVVGIDRDPTALEAAASALEAAAPEVPRVLCQGSFAELDEILVGRALPGADLFLFDLGVSSPQLDVADRGFSYHREAPLDMRMDPGERTLTAAEVVNTYNEADLARILGAYGGERHARRIAAAIVAARAKRAIGTTTELARIVADAYPARERGGRHPARKTFQALRIEVNGELDALSKGLEAAVRWLLPGGRIAVISYHSLEDRIVKRLFGELSKGCICPPELPVCVCGHVPVVDVLTSRPVTPAPEEVEANPRARSAKLRVARKREPGGASPRHPVPPGPSGSAE